MRWRLQARHSGADCQRDAVGVGLPPPRRLRGQGEAPCSAAAAGGVIIDARTDRRGAEDGARVEAEVTHGIGPLLVQHAHAAICYVGARASPEAGRVMKQQITTLITSGVLTLALIGTAIAGPFEDGQAAYRRDDYAEALRL